MGLKTTANPATRVPLFWHNDYAAIVVSASRNDMSRPSGYQTKPLINYEISSPAYGTLLKFAVVCR